MTTDTGGHPMEPLHPILRANADARRAAPPYRTQGVETLRQTFRATQTSGERGPEMASVSETTIAGPAGPLPVRLYTPANASGAFVVYLHGGGHVIGDLDTHDRSVRALAHASGAVMASVDYRLAPEHRFPAAVDDSVAAALAAPGLAKNCGADPARIFIGGDSAGASLALGAALVLRDAGRSPLAGVIAIYPIADQANVGATHSYRAFGGGDYGLSEDDVDWFRGHYLHPDHHRDPRASPLLAPDLSHLPPVVIVAGAYDPLRDEAALLVTRLVEAGVPVTFQLVPGVNHGFMGAPVPPPATARTLAFIAAWMNSPAA